MPSLKHNRKMKSKRKGVRNMSNQNDFCSHPFILFIAPNKKWTVSTKDKVPLDMFMWKYHGRICGAKFHDDASLVSLSELIGLLGQPANYAYWLDSVDDGFVVVDIEPACPENIKNKLLRLPYVYGERSMSGKGYHLVVPITTEFDDCPELLTKPAIKEKHKWYEILTNHFVTFTGNIIQPAYDNASLKSLIDYLKPMQTISNRSDFHFEDLADVASIPGENSIVSQLMDVEPKTLESFYGDISRYEFAYACKLYSKTQTVINSIQTQHKHFSELNENQRHLLGYDERIPNHEYTLNEKAYFIYLVLSEKLEHRLKHETFRQNLPWLLYLAQEAIAKSITSEDEPENEVKD